MKKTIKIICCTLFIGLIFTMFFCISEVKAKSAENSMRDWMNKITEQIQCDEEDKKRFEMVQKIILMICSRHHIEKTDGQPDKLICDEPKILQPNDYTPGTLAYYGSVTNDIKKIDEFVDSPDIELFKRAFQELKIVVHKIISIPEENIKLIEEDKTGNAELYFQTIKEQLALKYFLAMVDALYSSISGDQACYDNNVDLSSGLDLYKNLEYNTTGASFTIPCSYLECYKTSFDSLKKQVTALLDKIEKEQKKLEEKVDKSLVKWKNEINGKTDEAIDEAGEEIEPDEEDEEIPPIPPADWGNTDSTIGDSPEIKIEKLLERVSYVLGKGKDENLTNNFKSIIETIIDAFSNAGVIIMFMIIMFMGVKCIWTGAEGKAQFKEILPFLIVAIIFFWSARNVVDMVEDIFNVGTEIDSTELNNIKNQVWGTIIYIIRILAFAGIIFSGLKLMFSNAEGKADAKNQMIAILIGCILVFASSIVVKIVVDAFNDGIKVEKSKKEQNKYYIENIG